jgi:arabinofuranosyltransferase
MARGVPLMIFAFLAFIGSRTMVDFSTSGLENSLSHLLIFLAVTFLLQQQPPRERALCISLIFSAALMNRLDLVFLFMPLWLYAMLRKEVCAQWRYAMLGLLPIAGWLLFALLYYGSPLPNTYYAKLGVEAYSFVMQGIKYFIAQSQYDWVGSVVIIAALCFWLKDCILVAAKLQKLGVTLALGLGIVLHIAYIIHIGGDYMVGRFLSPVIISSLVLLVVSLPGAFKPALLTLFSAMVLSVAALYYAVSDHSCWLDRARCKEMLSPIQDNRSIVAAEEYGMTPWDSAWHLRARPNHVWVMQGMGLREQSPLEPVTTYWIGLLGYYAGASVTIIDMLALPDAFLARIPVGLSFMEGHIARPIPEGYLRSYLGDYSGIDGKLLPLVQEMALVTRGDLWSMARLRAIYQLNNGSFNARLRECYP